MKRILSFLMCLCMLVGLMPAAVMASDGATATDANLPEGYQQMYRDGLTETKGEAGMTPPLRFTLALNGAEIDVTKYTFTVQNDNDSNIGEVFLDGNVLRWGVSNTPGDTGYILAEEIDGDGKYAIKAEVGPAVFGVYTTSTLDISNYIIEKDGWSRFNYDTENRSIYIIPGYSEWSIVKEASVNGNTHKISLSNSNAEYELLTNGALKITLLEEISGVQDVTVTIPAKVDNNYEIWEKRIQNVKK